MRRSMNFGDLGDIEPMMQSEGLSLAPISTGDASLNVGGVTVLATAKGSDIDNGALKGLVLPGGAPDEESVAALNELIVKAMEKSVPILAFGEGVVQALRAAGLNPSDYADAPAILMEGKTVTALMDIQAVASAAGRIS